MIWQFFIIPLLVGQIPTEVEAGRMVIAARGMFREFHSEENYSNHGWMQPYERDSDANIQTINKEQKTKRNQMKKVQKFFYFQTISQNFRLTSKDEQN